MLEHLSDEMRALYPGRPAKGEIRKYVLDGIRKRATPEGGQTYTMPNSRSLPTSYPVMDGDVEKSIVYVNRVLPTEDPNKTTQELGYVEFRMEDACAISVSHENYNVTKNDDMFLFFSPFLIGAQKKPWYLKHKLGMFVIQESPELLAGNFIDTDMEIHNAKAVVYKMSKEMRGIVIDQLKLGHAARMSDKEMTAALIRYCEARIHGKAGAGAKRILTLAENKDVVLRKLIKTAVNMGKIKASDSGTEMIWVQGGGSICPKLAGKTLEDSMILFFVSPEGREVLGSLKAIIEAAAVKARNLKLKEEKEKNAPKVMTKEEWEAEFAAKQPEAAPVEIPNVDEVTLEDKEPDPVQPRLEDIPEVGEENLPKAKLFPEGEDEFGPLKGTKGWNKLNAQRKGVLNKKRRAAQEQKDTSIPVLDSSPEEAPA